MTFRSNDHFQVTNSQLRLLINVLFYTRHHFINVSGLYRYGLESSRTRATCDLANAQVVLRLDWLEKEKWSCTEPTKLLVGTFSHLFNNRLLKHEKDRIYRMINQFSL